MNWTGAQADRYQGMITAGYNLGFLISGLLFIQMRDLSPYKRNLTTKFLFIISTLSMTLPYGWVMILARLLQGFSVGILLSSSNTCIYQIALPEHRTVAVPMLTIYFGIAFILLSFVSIFDDGGLWMWRFIVFILAFVALVDFLIQLFYLRGTDSIYYLLKNKGRQKSSEILARVYCEDEKNRILDQFEKALSKKLKIEF